jgi:hypothetical protein
LFRSLTITVPREDAWCFEQAKLLARLARWSKSMTVVPPSDDEVRRVEELERAVVTGRMTSVNEGR